MLMKIKGECRERGKNRRENRAADVKAENKKRIKLLMKIEWRNTSIGGRE